MEDFRINYENCKDCGEYDEEAPTEYCKKCVCFDCEYDRSRCLDKLWCFKEEKCIEIVTAPRKNH